MSDSMPEALALQPSTSTQPYLIQLDALRAIAITGVLVAHHLPSSWWINSTLQWGGTGVRLFFVISGFLITGILLRARERVSSGQETIGGALKIFYIRRALRIFPIYYLVLAIAVAADTPPVRESILWHLAYATNFYISIQNSWPGEIAAFWSLAVEEQFYLIWPCFILLCPQKWLKAGIIGTIALGVVSRYLMVKFNFNGIWIASSLLTQLDLLGVGALLAWVNYQNPSHNYRSYTLCKIGLWIGTPLYFILHPLNNSGQGDHFTLTIAQLGLAGCCAWFVQRAARGFTGVVGRIFESKPVLQMGKLSYGIYVYHMFAPVAMYHFFHLPYIKDPVLRFPVSILITLTAAILSWKFIEQPILGFKKYFSYGEK
jgi:peptidoglycan/LPS O-acetylase OafA/YrhL